MARALIALFVAALGLAGAQAQTPVPSPALGAPRTAPNGPAGPPQPKVETAALTDNGEPLVLNGKSLPLGGTLVAQDLWAGWKARYVTDQGRVIDTANGLISHSEGQGYGMLLAVAANDRVAFERIWGWTRANLMVRDDELIAWRWEPDKRPAVADMNNATDGDILAAWALTEAAEWWGDVSYRAAARRIAVEIGRKTVLYKTKFGSLILPGVAGFSANERADGPVVNLSYWVFPAFARLNIVAPDVDWAGMTQSGLDLMRKSAFGKARLPTEWIGFRNAQPQPADGFAKSFGYNAIRIPLYMAMAGVGERDNYAPYAAMWSTRERAIGVVDVASGSVVEPMGEPGYRAVAALTQCVTSNTKVPGDLKNGATNENYYPATLRLLALIAVQMRYPACQ